MILWRISRHRDLSGAGGLKVPGRWHYAGQPIVYLAGSPSAALLEVCVHTSANDVPPAFTLLKIEGPDPEVFVIKPEDLPQGWRTRLEASLCHQARRLAPGLEDASRSNSRPGDGMAPQEGRRSIASTQRNCPRSEEHTSELQSPCNLVCRLL